MFVVNFNEKVSLTVPRTRPEMDTTRISESLGELARAISNAPAAGRRRFTTRSSRRSSN